MAPSSSASPDESGMLHDVNYVFGQHLYVRRLNIQLEDVFATLEENIRHIHLYCDTLDCKTTDAFVFKLKLPSHVRTLHIFARSFLSNVKAILCSADRDVDQEILFYYDQSVSQASLLVKRDISSPGIAINHHVDDCAEKKVNSDGSVTEAEHTHLFDQEAGPLNLATSLAAEIGDDESEFAALANSKRSTLAPIKNSPGRKIVTRAHGHELEIFALKAIPPFELEEPSVGDMQAFGDDVRKTSNLLGLLYKILQAVSKTIFTGQDIPIMISRLRFIIQCAHSSPSLNHLTANAQQLVERLECSMSHPAISSSKDVRYYVPEVNVVDCIEGLKVRVTAANRIQTQLDTLNDKIKSEKEFHQCISTILDQMGTNVADVMRSVDSAETAQTAVENWKDQRRAMTSSNKDLKTAQNAFDSGVQKYYQEKQQELTLEWVKIGGELIVSVITTVSACGAGAPLTIGTLKKAQEAIEKGLETSDKLVMLITKVGEAAASIIPKMMTASDRRQACSDVMDKINNAELGDSSLNRQGFKGAADALTQKTLATLPEDVTAKVNYIGIRADWEVFAVTVQELFTEIQHSIGGDTIAGMTDYKIALQSQAIKGRAVITAMKRAHEAVQIYVREEFERKIRIQRSEELKALAIEMRDPTDTMKSDFAQALKWNLRRESISARSNLFVCFHECFLALIYQANDPSKVKRFFDGCEKPPMLSSSSAEDFNTVLGYITTGHREYSSTYNEAVFEIQASKYPDMFPEWQTTLTTDMKICFKIAHDRIASMRNWHHLRIKYPSANLIGFNIRGTKHAYQWSFGPESVDVDLYGKPISYYSTAKTLMQTGGIGGWNEHEAKFPHPTLFSQGELTVCPEPTDLDSPPPKLDLSGVTDIILSFECYGKSRLKTMSR